MTEDYFMPDFDADHVRGEHEIARSGSPHMRMKWSLHLGNQFTVKICLSNDRTALCELLILEQTKKQSES